MSRDGIFADSAIFDKSLMSCTVFNIFDDFLTTQHLLL